MPKTTLASLEKRIKTLEIDIDAMGELAKHAIKALTDTDDYWQFHDRLKHLAEHPEELVPDAL